MIVVSDTSILSGLVQIDQLILLQQVYSRVIIPHRVYLELLRLNDYGIDVEKQLAVEWIEVKGVFNTILLTDLQQELDAGEAEAIALAVELNATLLLIDELRGRVKAQQVGLSFTGLLGTLKVAKQKGYIPAMKPIIDELQQKAGMWYKPALLKQVLESVDEY